MVWQSHLSVGFNKQRIRERIIFNEQRVRINIDCRICRCTSCRCARDGEERRSLLRFGTFVIIQIAQRRRQWPRKRRGYKARDAGAYVSGEKSSNAESIALQETVKTENSMATKTHANEPLVQFLIE